MTDLDLVIIGGGQAGLAAGYYASSANLKYTILEQSPQLGLSWNERYESLVLFSTGSYSSLPGLKFPGRSNSLPSKQQVVDYLQNYQEHFNLNVELNQRVESLTKADKFITKTSSATYHSRAIIVATGPFQYPKFPRWAKDVVGVPYIHSSDYKRPEDAVGKRVVVIGSGNSAVQIAEELANTHNTTLAIRQPMKFIPAKIGGRSFLWWFDRLGLLKAPINSGKGRLMYRHSGVLVGGNTLQKLVKQQKITIKPPAKAYDNGEIVFDDLSRGSYDSIIFATGYGQIYPWLQVPGALTAEGTPNHSFGKSSKVAGLYYLGLKGLRTGSSALLCGVGADAKNIVDDVKMNADEKGYA